MTIVVVDTAIELLSQRANLNTYVMTPDSAFDTTLYSREMKNYFEVNENENYVKICGMPQTQCLEACIAKALPACIACMYWK